jgi:hypothetical protein
MYNISHDHTKKPKIIPKAFLYPFGSSFNVLTTGGFPIIALPKTGNAWIQLDDKALHNPQDQCFIKVVKLTQVSIDCVTTNINARPFLNALQEAIARGGVHIRILTCKGYEQFKQNLPFQGGGNESALNHWVNKYPHVRNAIDHGQL